MTDTHVIREGNDPKRGRYWGLIGESGGDYGWRLHFSKAETFTAEQATELAMEFRACDMPCIAVAIADINDDSVAP